MRSRALRIMQNENYRKHDPSVSLTRAWRRLNDYCRQGPLGTFLSKSKIPSSSRFQQAQ